MNNILMVDQGTKLTFRDPSLYMKFIEAKLIGIVGIYVDGSLNAGNGGSQNLSILTLKTFESKLWVYDRFTPVGAQLYTEDDCSFSKLGNAMPMPYNKSRKTLTQLYFDVHDLWFHGFFIMNKTALFERNALNFGKQWIFKSFMQ